MTTAAPRFTPAALLACLLQVLAATPALAATAGVQRLASGVVIPEREVAVAAKVVGRIAAMPYDEGAAVAQGEVLVQLEDAQWQAELQAGLAAARLAEIEVERKRKHRDRIKGLRERSSASEDALDNASFDLAAAEASLRSARADVDKLRALLAETRIVAPFDAIVTRRIAEVGTVTSPGSPLLELQDQRRLKLRTRIKEKDIPHIRTGQIVTVSIDALAGVDLMGTVSTVIPAGDARTHTFEVEIALPPSEGLYPGMFGQASF